MTQNSINNSASDFTVDNIFLDGNTISTLSASNLVFDPDGTGSISLTTTANLLCSGDRTQDIGDTTNAWDNLYLDGITFDDGTNTMANFVDVTSFTPIVTYAGGASGITYSLQQGYYSRIGNLVFVTINLVITSRGTATGGGTSEVRVGDLPFTSAHACNMYFSRWRNFNLTSYTSAVPVLDASTDYLRLTKVGSATGSASLTYNDINDNTQIFISGTYII